VEATAVVAGLLLTLREGLEAALLIGITLGAIQRMRQPSLRRFVWLGVAAAVLISLAVAASLQAVGATLTGDAEAIFEGMTLLLAAGVLTWMILWLQRQGRRTQVVLETDVQRAAQRQQSSIIFLIAFTAVLREGIETALFLSAAAMTARAVDVLAGALLGLVAAVTLGYALYASALRLNLHRFFQVTGLLLMLFAAGLVAHAVHELNEVGMIPAIVAPLWDINHVLDENSYLGLVFRALFGYNANPSLSEALAYSAYFVMLGVVLLRMPRRPSRAGAGA
jgi:high-affinity iron transporter